MVDYWRWTCLSWFCKEVLIRVGTFLFLSLSVHVRRKSYYFCESFSLHIEYNLDSTRSDVLSYSMTLGSVNWYLAEYWSTLYRLVVLIGRSGGHVDDWMS